MHSNSITLPTDNNPNENIMLEWSNNMTEAVLLLIKYLGAILGSLGLLGGSIYMVARRLKGDGKSDQLDDKSHKIINALESQLEAERALTKGLHESIDRVAKERNAAVSNLGRVEGHVQALEQQVANLRDEIHNMDLENQRLSALVTETNSAMVKMTNEFAAILAIIKSQQGIQP
jgi:hypothetical protein